MTATKTEWKHDALAGDLAQHLISPHRMIWCDMQLGPAGSPRPDVYAIDKSFAHTRAISYECKVSVADFRSDVTAGKWQGYLGFSSGVYFCVPSGLIARDDVPKGAGLMVRGDAGWRTLRAPTLQTCDIDWVVCRKLLIDGIDRMVRAEPRAERTPWGAAKKIAKRWGQEAARVLADLESAQARVQHWEEKAERHRAEIGDVDEKIRSRAQAMCDQWLADFAQSLGLSRGSTQADVCAKFGALREALEGRSRWRRDNLEQVTALLESELTRVREIRELLGEEVRT